MYDLPVALERLGRPRGLAEGASTPMSIFIQASSTAKLGIPRDTCSRRSSAIARGRAALAPLERRQSVPQSGFTGPPIYTRQFRQKLVPLDAPKCRGCG